MTKQSGLGDNAYVAGYNLSGDTQSLQRIGGGVAAIDVTGIDKSAYERIGGLRDGSIDWTSFFNPGTDRAHSVLKNLPTSDVHVMYCRGTAIGSPAACCVGRQIGYDPARGADGSLTFGVNVTASGYGVEWSTLLTPGVRTDSAAANGTSHDNGVGTNFGGQAYLQAFTFTGTSCTVKIQQSSDNGGADAWADLMSFTAVSAAHNTQRIFVANNTTVERYLRVVTTGVFSDCSFAVAFVRNETAVVF